MHLMITHIHIYGIGMSECIMNVLAYHIYNEHFLGACTFGHSFAFSVMCAHFHRNFRSSTSAQAGGGLYALLLLHFNL